MKLDALQNNKWYHENEKHFCLQALVGSHSHNTYIPPSDPNAIDDVDLMIITCFPVEHYLGLNKFEGISFWVNEYDVVVYDIVKLFRLLLKNNPNVLGLLWLKPEFYLTQNNQGRMLIANRELFSSKLAYKSFCGYANGQLKRMTHLAYEGYMGEKRKRLVQKFGYDTKNAAHCIRLLKTGCEFLETGRVNVFRDKDRQEIIDIKTGTWTLEAVKLHAKYWFNKLHCIVKHSPLPEKPDFKKVNELLIEIIKTKR